MTGPTDVFFDQLAAREHVPGLRNRSVSIRFDVAGKGVDRWRVDVDRGDIRVSRGEGTADCMIAADRALFDDLVTGRANALASVLCGTLLVDGDAELMMTARQLILTAEVAS